MWEIIVLLIFWLRSFFPIKLIEAPPEIDFSYANLLGKLFEMIDLYSLLTMEIVTLIKK